MARASAVPQSRPVPASSFFSLPSMWCFWRWPWTRKVSGHWTDCPPTHLSTAAATPVSHSVTAAAGSLCPAHAPPRLLRCGV